MVEAETHSETQAEEKCEADSGMVNDEEVIDTDVSREKLAEELAEELAIESVIGGVEVEQELQLEPEEIVEGEANPNQEDFVTEAAIPPAEDFDLTLEGPLDPIMESPEVHEDAEAPAEASMVEVSAEAPINEPLLVVETTEETLLELVPVMNLELSEVTPEVAEGELSMATAEDVDSEVSPPKEEVKEQKSPKSSRKSKLPKKLGAKKAKK